MINREVLSSSLRSKKLLIKLLLSYLGTAIVAVLLITLLNTYWVKNESIKDINSITELALSNIAVLGTNMFESTQNMAFVLYNDPYVKNLLSSSEIDGLDIMGVTYDIERLKISNPSIFSVYVWNKNSIVFRTSRGIGYEESHETISEIVKEGPVLYPVPRRISNNSDKPVDVYTIIYHEPGLGDDSAIVLNIDANALYNQVYTEFSKPQQDIFIVDKTGKVLLHNDIERLSANIKNETYFRNAVAADRSSGSFSVYDGGHNWVYNYVIAKNKKYIVFSKSEYSMLFSKVTKIRNTILLTCSVVLVLIFFLSIMLSRWLYTPINNVFSNISVLFKGSNISQPDKPENNEYKFISQAVGSLVQRLNTLEKDNESNFNIMRTAFFKSVLTEPGNINKDLFPDNILKYKILNSINGNYCIIVMRLDNYNDFLLNNNKEAIDFQLSSIGNISSETLKEISTSTYFVMDNEHLVLVISDINRDNTGYEEEITEAVEHAQDSILKLLNIGITIGISGVSSNIFDIKDKYDEAFGFTNYRFIYGKNTIFTGKTVKIKEMEKDKVNHYANAILNSIKNGSKDAYCDFIFKYYSLIRNCSYDKIVKLFFQLANSILHLPEELQTSHKGSMEFDIQDIYAKIRSFESYEDLINWFEELFDKTETILCNIRNKKNPDLVEQVLKYINENYRDSNISANIIADKLSITPQYFSKIFNEYAGVSFPDYINNVRLEKAKELILSNEKLNIGSIYEMVGYNNRSYFTSSFTKKYGISPGRFRSETASKKISES